MVGSGIYAVRRGENPALRQSCGFRIHRRASSGGCLSPAAAVRRRGGVAAERQRYPGCECCRAGRGVRSRRGDGGRRDGSPRGQRCRRVRYSTGRRPGRNDQRAGDTVGGSLRGRPRPRTSYAAVPLPGPFRPRCWPWTMEAETLRTGSPPSRAAPASTRRLWKGPSRNCIASTASPASTTRVQPRRWPGTTSPGDRPASS